MVVFLRDALIIICVDIILEKTTCRYSGIINFVFWF